jgi:hypothetical protein
MEIPRMRVGKRQTLETLISGEALLLAEHLRNENKDGVPRIGITEQNGTGMRALPL